MTNIREKAHQYLPDTIACRRDFHMYPEISGYEERTSNVIKSKLQELGIKYWEVSGYGIIGEIYGEREGRTVALRADIDALPIQEQTEKPYCSQIKGVGHLCGHDCHTASLLTAARILHEESGKIQGTVRLLFQPSEEAGGGAEIMISEQAMQNVDAVFGVHMYNELDVGMVSVQEGPRMAASLRGHIEIKGIGGHGGSPHLCVDPIVTASAIVMNLQTITSRELNVLDSAIITVGKFHAGTSQFAVAEKAELYLTIKFFNASLVDKIRESITRIVEKTAESFRAQCTVRIDGFLEPVINDKRLSDIAEKSAANLFGKDSVVSCLPWTASEDFSKYEQYAPGIFAFIGGRNNAKGCVYKAHHPCFDIDENALEVASAMYAKFAIDYLNQQEDILKGA